MKGENMKRLLFFMAGAALLLTGCGEPTTASPGAVEIACENAIRAGVAGDVKFSGQRTRLVSELPKSETWEVTGTAEGTNAFGGPVKQSFYCKIGWMQEPDTYEVVTANLN